MRGLSGTKTITQFGMQVEISKSPDPASLALGKEYHSRNRLTILHSA
jgi:hypothetical protein